MLVVIDRKYRVTFEFLLSCWVDDQPAEIQTNELKDAETLPDGHILYRDLDPDFAGLLARQNIPFEKLEDLNASQEHLKDDLEGTVFQDDCG